MNHQRGAVPLEDEDDADPMNRTTVEPLHCLTESGQQRSLYIPPHRRPSIVQIVPGVNNYGDSFDDDDDDTFSSYLGDTEEEKKVAADSSAANVNPRTKMAQDDEDSQSVPSQDYQNDDDDQMQVDQDQCTHQTQSVSTHNAIDGTQFDLRSLDDPLNWIDDNEGFQPVKTRKRTRKPSGGLENLKISTERSRVHFHQEPQMSLRSINDCRKQAKFWKQEVGTDWTSPTNDKKTVFPHAMQQQLETQASLMVQNRHKLQPLLSTADETKKYSSYTYLTAKGGTKPIKIDLGRSHAVNLTRDLGNRRVRAKLLPDVPATFIPYRLGHELNNRSYDLHLKTDALKDLEDNSGVDVGSFSEPSTPSP